MAADIKIMKFTDDIMLFKQDVGYWRYAFVDIFLKLFIPLANGCVRTFANILLILHTYGAKIGYLKAEGLQTQLETKQLNNGKQHADWSRGRRKLCSNLRAHPHMMSLPLQTFYVNLSSPTVQQCCKLHILAQPPKHTPIRADIIFIHGLHGSVLKTWRQGLWSSPALTFMFERTTDSLHAQHAKYRARASSEERKHLVTCASNMENFVAESNCNGKYTQCWPADWLPLDCPGVRVIALDYTTEAHMWRPIWIKRRNCTNMRERAREMMELLLKERVGFDHPIIWVGHSKGGLFIKQIIVDAWESRRPAATTFCCATRGIFFYSVPHRGSTLATIRAPLLARSIELQEVAKDNLYLKELHERFLQLYFMGHLQVEVFTFAETALTLLSMFYLRIVEINSADPGIGDIFGIHLDHKDICKPRNRNCILYRKLVEMIQQTT